MKTLLLALALTQLWLGALPLAAAQYRAHEWGTFTSLQSAGGDLLPWRPIVTAELPGFVYDRSQPEKTKPVDYSLSLGIKPNLVALQRMETPVIYFYADQPQSVDVTVRLPKGMITEWYPRVDDFGPKQKTNTESLAMNNSFIQWTGVRLQPGPAAVPFPQDASGSHYFAARATGAVPLQKPGIASGPGETEKFLFYRGLGNFTTPLRVEMNAQNGITLKNNGHRELRHLVVLQVAGHKARFVTVPRLAPGAMSTRVDLEGQKLRLGKELEPALRGELERGLVSEGLYAREASAMVETWRTSWLEEDGVRVLYTLPREWTDDTLPLTLSPAPRELVRVMIGRAEIITPRMEKELGGLVKDYVQDQAGEAALKSGYRKLGRFADVILGRVMEMEKLDQGEMMKVYQVLRELRQPPLPPQREADKLAFKFFQN